MARLSGLFVAALALVPLHIFAATPPQTLIVAHRGLLRHAPENTLANFRACLELRLGFEFDVEKTKDGQLVCIHDSSVDRTTNGKGKVAELTLDDIRRMDAGSWFDARFAGEKVPTIEEVLKLVAEYQQHEVLISVDLKAENVAPEVVRLAEKHKVLHRLLFIGRTISEPQVRDQIKRTSTKAQTAAVANNLNEFPQSLAAANADWVYFRYLPSKEQMQAVHAAGKRAFIAGMSVGGNLPENWRHSAGVGIDGILTDYPLELRMTLRQFEAPNPQATAKTDAELTKGNPWSSIEQYFSPPHDFKGKFGPFKSPLQFADGATVTTAMDWQRRRNEIRKQWTDLLGTWPPLNEKPQVELLETIRRDNFTQHRIHFQWTPRESTTGYLLIPDGTGKRPAVLTVYYEPETAVGLKGEQRDFAYQLARRGFVTLSIGTTEASAADTYSLYYPDIDNAKVQPLSMLAYAAANAWYVLASRPEVDADRIGIVGHSFGGKWALFAGCLFDRFAAVAVSDPGIMFDTHSSVNYWEPWYLGWHPRPWRARGLVTPENPAKGLYPKLLEEGHDLHELQALLAPRPFLVSGGAVDPPERWKALNHLIQINEVLGQKNRVGMTNRPDHAPNPDSNGVIYAFFEHFLQQQPVEK